MRKKAKFEHFLTCMLLLIVSTLIFYSWNLEQAKQDYIVKHNIPNIYHPETSGFWGREAYYTKPILSYDDIGNNFRAVIHHTLLFLVFYPIFGRLLVFVAQGLTTLFDKLALGLNINFSGEPFAFNSWTPELILYGAVLSPITVIAIVLLLIANLLMFIYRFLV